MTSTGEWTAGAHALELHSGVLVGVLNVTPDSFSDGNAYPGPSAAIEHAQQMVANGATVIDVGGESTRPGAERVPTEVESQRVLPVVHGLVANGIVVSIDTYDAVVAMRALEAGASIVNDVSGFGDPAMVDVVAGADCGVVAMCGRDAGVDLLASGVDVVGQVESYLNERVAKLVAAGVEESRIVVDPGLGFAKTPAQSLEILSNVDRLAVNGRRVMIGASRKGFLSRLGGDTWEERDLITATISALSFVSGARVFRVHDVARSRDALRVAAAIVAHH